MRTPFAGLLFVAFLATVAARAFPYGDYAPATPARRSRARVEYAESLAHGGSSSTSDGLATAGRGASARDASHASTLGNSDDAVEARMSSARVTARSVDPDDTWATVSRRDDDPRTTRATSDDDEFGSSSTLDDEKHDPFPSAVEDPRDRNASHEDDVSDPFPSAVDGADDEDAPDPDAPYLSVDDIPDPDGALDDEESGEEDGRGADEHAGGMDVEIDDEDRALNEEFHAESEAEARRTKRDDRVEVEDELEDELELEVGDARVDDEFDVSTSSLTSPSAGRQRRAGSNDYADAL